MIKGGRGNSKGGLHIRKRSGKYFHCGKEGYIKKNCFVLKEYKEANNEKKNDTHYNCFEPVRMKRV